MKKRYELTLYVKTTLFDRNLKLVFRWVKVDKKIFTRKSDAIRQFTVLNRISCFKAVLRLQRGGKKRG